MVIGARAMNGTTALCRLDHTCLGLFLLWQCVEGWKQHQADYMVRQFNYSFLLTDGTADGCHLADISTPTIRRSP